MKYIVSKANSYGSKKFHLLGLVVCFCSGMTVIALSSIANAQPFLPAQVHVVSTIPANGDLNPYGVAFVPQQFPAGTLNPGDILVSNFNNNQNLQGTGSTIVNISENGTTSVFFQGAGLMGLTTALNILKKGFVLVGNFPSPDGICEHAQDGSILVIDKNGNHIQSIEDPNYINGPWDSTLYEKGDQAKLFVANALTGTIVRLDLSVSATGITVQNKTTIVSGYKHQCDPVTFVDGPTGLVYDTTTDVLYVASTMDNAIFAVPHAGITTKTITLGSMIFSNKNHLHGPLAMMRARNGNLVVSNNDAINPDPKHLSALTEFTIQGTFIKEITVDANLGAAFGLSSMTSNDVTYFAAVNDVMNMLFIWTLQNAK